jgi:hypothetical protein
MAQTQQAMGSSPLAGLQGNAMQPLRQSPAFQQWQQGGGLGGASPGGYQMDPAAQQNLLQAMANQPPKTAGAPQQPFQGPTAFTTGMGTPGSYGINAQPRPTPQSSTGMQTPAAGGFRPMAPGTPGRPGGFLPMAPGAPGRGPGAGKAGGQPPQMKQAIGQLPGAPPPGAPPGAPGRGPGGAKGNPQQQQQMKQQMAMLPGAPR